MTPPVPPIPPTPTPATTTDIASLVSAMNTLVATMQTNNQNTQQTNRTQPSLMKKLTDNLSKVATKLDDMSARLERFNSTLIKTQKDFGLSLTGAAKLQAQVIKDTIVGYANMLGSIDLGQLASGLGDVLGAMFETGTSVMSGMISGGLEGAKQALVAGGQNIINEITKERPGPEPTREPTREERLESLRQVQQEFGVLDTNFANGLAKRAAQFGLNIQQLVQSTRAFSTITLGSLSKAEVIQTRFFDVFKSKGMTPKVALDAITKYSELIARNGTRFADSFARAAADAKKIGVDLNKVSQFGDNIIDNFEGFLESQATLGAMGFGFDSNRLAEIAETGSDADLFNELRSQLAATGKDITNLRRSERLELESAFGINISELQRLAGGTPELSPEELQQEGNSILGQILTLLIIAGPVFSFMSNTISAISAAISAGGALFGLVEKIATYLGPFGIVGGTLALLGGWIRYQLSSNAYNKVEELSDQAKKQYGSGNVTEGSESLAKAALTEINALEFIGGDSPEAAIRLRYQQMDKEQRFLAPRYQPGIFGPVSPAREITGGLYRLPQFFPVEKTGERYNQRLINEAIFKGHLLTTEPPQVKRASGGPVIGPGSETSDSIPARLSNGEYVVKASAVKKPGVKDLLDTINHGTESVMEKARGGFISRLLNRGMSMFGGRMPMVPQLFNTFQQSGIRGVGSSLLNRGLGMLGNRIPGFSGALNAFNAFRTGGIGGALKSVARGGIGKMLGGVLGSAIPIPGIGTAIGSLMGSKVGKLIGGLFGRRKKPVAQQIMGALPDIGGFAGNLIGKVPGMERFNPEAFFRGMAGQPQAQTAVQAVVDTTGIEQKLNNFINALNNVNIVMDGAKVGKMLVNVTDAASTVGVFKPTSRATL